MHIPILVAWAFRSSCLLITPTFVQTNHQAFIEMEFGDNSLQAKVNPDRAVHSCAAKHLWLFFVQHFGVQNSAKKTEQYSFRAMESEIDLDRVQAHLVGGLNPSEKY